jgi:hypothetical protein
VEEFLICVRGVMKMSQNENMGWKSLSEDYHFIKQKIEDVLMSRPYDAKRVWLKFLLMTARGKSIVHPPWRYGKEMLRKETSDEQ